ncbi:MAG: enoyl-CoA hydratase/isomerase family protein [Ardenticatenia bacterium]|nr:enoyl-CoA hydratase/isomerase family protein [Ardenticatenia bacterium]
MSQALILKEGDGRVALLTLNNPAKRNAMNYALVDALDIALKEVEADPEVRVAVIAGAGDHFSAGGDLEEFAQELGLSAHKHWKSADPWIDLFRLVRAMRKPVIAAVQGYPLAGGCGLGALCGIAISSGDARVGNTGKRDGLFPISTLPTLRPDVGGRQGRRKGVG